MDIAGKVSGFCHHKCWNFLFFSVSKASSSSSSPLLCAFFFSPPGLAAIIADAFASYICQTLDFLEDGCKG
jgi:hypothetical protein